MHFTNTIWLWGLAGLILPIAIHLLSRKTGNLIRFGSIRHLTETNTKQFKSIRLNELALLMLRSLFVILVVLFFAGVHSGDAEKKTKWLLIEQGMEKDPDYASLIDSLTTHGFQMKALSPGFPAVNNAVKIEKVDYWNLLQDVSAKGDVVVLSYSYASGFKGKRISLPKTVQWLSKEPDSVHYPLTSVKFSSDSVAVRMGVTQADRTSFHTYKKRGISAASEFEQRDSISVAVVFDPLYAYDRNILVAALMAVHHQILYSLKVESIPTSRFSAQNKYDWVMWLSESAPPATPANLIRIANHHLVTENFLSQIKSTGGKTWLITQRLNEEVALQENLAVQLAMMLSPDKDHSSRVREFDRRVLPEKLRWSTFSEGPLSANVASDVTATEKYIGLALLIILFAERLLAFKRGQ